MPTFVRLLASDLAEAMATVSGDWPAVAGNANAMLQQTGWRDALFVEAIADHRGRADDLNG